MASQVLSGANNASYTNNTGQNVRLIINYMANVTSMTWAGVVVTGSSTNVGKNIPVSYTSSSTSGTVKLDFTNASRNYFAGTGGSAVAAALFQSDGVDVLGTITAGTLSLTPSTNSNFPVELMLASGQSFSAVCGAYNAIIIKEDGT